MQLSCKSGGVKQKKYALFVKQMKSFTITDAVALMLLIHQHKIISAMILNLTSIFKKSYEIKKGGGGEII